MDWKEIKRFWSKFWYFFWEDDSLLSWVLNIIVAFILIKWIVYPVLGLILSTSHPVVAVVSGSMEHDGTFDDWWGSQEKWYTRNNITMEDFEGFSFRNGFNKGDIMVLYGTDYRDLEVGDVIVFIARYKYDPIIHRVVEIDEHSGRYYFTTKGDHNLNSYDFESNIPQEQIIGRAVFRVPFLGYIKIWAVDLLKLLHIIN